MIVRRRKMNKKLIASLLALGLVFSPVTGAIAKESHEIKIGDKEENEALKQDKTRIIEKYVEEFEELKKHNNFRHASREAQAGLVKAIENAEEYIKLDYTKISELQNHVDYIENSIEKVSNSANENLFNLKSNILKLEKLLKGNDNKKDSEDYQKALAYLSESKKFLKSENLNNISGEDITRATDELASFYKDTKANLNDDSKYPPLEDQDFINLEKEVDDSEVVKETNNYSDLNSDIVTLFNNNDSFVKSEKYAMATEEAKKAYNDALDKLIDLNGVTIDDKNYDEVLKIASNLAHAKYYIDGENLNLKVVRVRLSQEDIRIKSRRYIDILTSYLNERPSVIGNIKDTNLKKEYKLAIEDAQLYTRLYARGIVKGINDYQQLVDKLSGLTNQIKSDNSSSKGNAEDKTPGPIKPEESPKKQFENIDAAKKGLEDLINRTKGIVIDDFYGAEEKDAKESYIKNRDEAIKAKDNKDASLDDLTKAYENFNKSITDLSTFLRNRLQKLVDEDKDFRESEKFKKANENVVKSYDEIIKKAKEEIAKTEADANDLNKLYSDINIAKEAIEDNLSDQARRLESAISESESFKNKYKDFGNGLEGPQKTAKKRYEELINKAKELDKAGKLDSDEAKTTLELIENTKAFIEGKISEKKYLSNEYYHILKELKNQKGYEEKVNQAARDRIDEALKLYEKGEKDEETIYSALDAALKEDSVKEFINEINKSKDPNKTRDELLSKLRTLAEEEENFKAGEKYKNAPKELKADYDKALEEAKKIIEKENPKEAEIKDSYEKLKDAVNKIEIRHIIDRRLVVLADKFKENQLKIKNPADRKAIADKINALKNNPYTTMEEVEKVEAELDKLIKTQQAVTTTTVAPQSQAPAGQVPTTTRPVSIVTNPGSIVKTGINGIAKVAAVLAVAAIILKLTSKKGEKDETNK